MYVNGTSYEYHLKLYRSFNFTIEIFLKWAFADHHRCRVMPGNWARNGVCVIFIYMN